MCEYSDTYVKFVSLEQVVLIHCLSPVLADSYFSFVSRTPVLLRSTRRRAQTKIEVHHFLHFRIYLQVLHADYMCVCRMLCSTLLQIS